MLLFGNYLNELVLVDFSFFYFIIDEMDCWLFIMRVIMCVKLVIGLFFYF